MKLHLSKAGSSVKIELRDALGELKQRVSSRFNSDDDFEKVANKLELEKDLLRKVIDAFENGGPEIIDLERKRKIVYMRPIHSQERVQFIADTIQHAFVDALAAVNLDMDEPIISWESHEDVAALDIDANTFTDAILLTLENVPTPAYSWVTKSGGARMIYFASDGFTAEEVAAVAYMGLLSSYKHMEIKNDTRHPAYISANGTMCGQVFTRQQDFQPSHLRRHLRLYSMDDTEAADYLQTHGLQQGQNYEHSKCPIDGQRQSDGKPVTVVDNGIYCFSCAAHGVYVGSSKAGFFPFAYLCGNSASALLYRCMENRTHWEHAKYIIENKLSLTGRYAELIYSAGLLLHKTSRKAIKRTFDAGRNFIRMADRWTNLCGETYGKDIKPILASLPACCVGEKCVQDKARVAMFEQNHDLSIYGYPSIKPIYGLKIWPGESEEITAVIQTRDLSAESKIKLRPTYKVPAKRPDPWPTIERTFPGVDRNYIKLLIAARGVAEGGVSMLPIVFVTGVTGAGKSLSVFLAASICGDTNTEVLWTTNTDRLRQSIVDANGSFVTFNEAMKEAKGSVQAMDFILNLTPDSVSHYMYVGPTRMGRLPAIILTDSELNPRIKQDAQLARRIVHVHLNKLVDWETSCKFSGLSHPGKYRLLNEHTAEACNNVLSEVMDEFFAEPITFQAVAERLGYNRLTASAEAEEARQTLRKLFFTCAGTKDANGESFVSGRGWKLIKRDVVTALRDVWLDVCEDNFTSSRRCSEIDWQLLLGASQNIRFELRTHGTNTVAVRFTNGVDKFNQECL